jgi:hypothetical protein
VPKHDNWDNYERAVQDATDSCAALTRLLDSPEELLTPELARLAVVADYALGDPLCALQEAENWHRARSALLFWETRWPRAAVFTALAERSEDRAGDARTRAVVQVAGDLTAAHHALRFVRAELDARLVAFREIRPQSVAAAARVAYLEHRHS